MNWADGVNGIFEAAGGAFVAINALDIWRKKAVAGQTLTAMSFFGAWGAWNLVYYPAIHQWWSAASAAGVMIANITMIGLILKFREKASA